MATRSKECSVQSIAINYTPSTHSLCERQATKLGWHDGLAEVIDNAFDAGATRVEFIRNSDCLAVIDDGTGFRDISAAVSFGTHAQQSTTCLGQYGIGLKAFWLWLADRMIIHTIHKTHAIDLDVSASEIEQDKETHVWSGPNAIVSDAKPGECGTRIEFWKIYRDRTKPQAGTLEKLGQTFMPALLAGKQITWKDGAKRRKPIVPYTMPTLIQSVEASFEVEGKGVLLVIGILPEGASTPQPGYALCYGHRLIGWVTLGCEGYSVARISGSVTLDRKWRLTPHKNDISELADQLADAIRSHIMPILEQSQKLAETLHSEHLRNELELTINQTISSLKKREKRDHKEDGDHGTVLPKFTGRKRVHATKTQDGNGSITEPSAKPKPRRGISLEFAAIDSEEIGTVDPLGKRVTLNTSNAFIASREKAADMAALYAVAFGLLCFVDETRDGAQRLLLLDKSGFPHAWGVTVNELKD